MTIDPSHTDARAADGEVFCYGHPRTPTRLRCSRCDRPICGRCAIPATVGQHCPECVAEARRSAPRVRTVLQATAPATRAILIVTALVFVGQLVLPGLTSLFGSSPPAIAAGEWWRLVTPMLVHAGAFHILMNGYVLFALGPAVEQRFGPARFVVIYVLAGLAGSTASFAFGPCRTLGVGASGAILGLIGALIANLYRHRDSPHAQMQLQAMLRWVGFIFAIGIGFELLNRVGVPFLRIDNFAHLGGLLGGAAVGLVVGTDRRPVTGTRLAGVVLVAAAVLLLAAWKAATFVC